MGASRSKSVRIEASHSVLTVPPPLRRRWLFQAAAACLSAAGSRPGLAQAGAHALPQTADETWVDLVRQRAVPVRIRWPDDNLAVPPDGHPVVIFSHGLGGTLAAGDFWGRAWRRAGCVVLHLQHPGSDLTAVRSQARDFADQSGLRRAARPEQLLARFGDVAFVLDELARRKTAATGRWAKVRPQGVGLSGHSFGAHTTLGMAGQRYPRHPGISEPRLSAFIAFSPTLPAVGEAVTAFERITRPVLCVTGTRDDDVMGNGATPNRRIGVFDALPAGQKAQLVLDEADHMSFSGQTGTATEILPRHPVSRLLQSQHHALVAAITSDWWQAHLMDNRQALQRLVRPTGLAAGDRWRTG
jgi:predicted dienelactone hydrolase